MYVWRKDGEILTGDDRMGRVLRIELANAQRDAGLYECSARNNNGFDSVRSTLEFLSKRVLLVSDFTILGPVQYPGSYTFMFNWVPFILFDFTIPVLIFIHYSGHIQ